VSRVITVTCNHDVGAFALCLAMGPHSVSEAGRHVWHRPGMNVLELAGERLTSPVVVHWVCRELISPDTIRVVISLVVVDHELAVAVVVEVDHGHIVCRENELIVDDLALDERAVNG